jgi:AcrR family transcriptional regulator
VARSTLRARQREQARSAILEAALSQFLAHGYVGATVAGIATDAGVAERTVYNHFDTKAGLMLALINDRIGVGLGRSPDDVDADPATSLRQALIAAGESLRAVVEQAEPLFRVASEAAVVDEEVAERLESQERFRYEDQGRLVEHLAERGLVRTDVSVEWLKRSYWLLAGPDAAMRALDAGWSVDDYVRWVVDSATGLMAPTPPESSTQDA